MRPATPAAVSRCPTFVLSDPMAQMAVASCVSRKAWVSPLISSGSPTAVPVPCVFDVRDALGIHAGDSQRLGNHFGLTGDAGRQISHLALAIVVHRRAQDDGVNRIVVGDGIFKPPQHDDADAAGKDRSAEAASKADSGRRGKESRPHDRGSRGHGGSRW